MAAAIVLKDPQLIALSERLREGRTRMATMPRRPSSEAYEQQRRALAGETAPAQTLGDRMQELEDESGVSIVIGRVPRRKGQDHDQNPEPLTDEQIARAAHGIGEVIEALEDETGETFLVGRGPRGPRGVRDVAAPNPLAGVDVEEIDVGVD